MKTTTKSILKLLRGIKKNLWFYKRNRIQFWVFLQLTQRGWDLVSQLLTYSPNLLLENIPSKQPTSHHRKGGRSGVILSRSLSSSDSLWFEPVLVATHSFVHSLAVSCCLQRQGHTMARAQDLPHQPPKCWNHRHVVWCFHSYSLAFWTFGEPITQLPYKSYTETYS